MEWPCGEEFAPDTSASTTSGRAAHGQREWYLAKECFGSDRTSKERSQLPAATTTELNPLESVQQRIIKPNNQQKMRLRTVIPLRSNPDGNRPHLTNSFRNGWTNFHAQRGQQTAFGLQDRRAQQVRRGGVFTDASWRFFRLNSVDAPARTNVAAP